MAYGQQHGLNAYLADLFGTGDVFDGQGGFWKELDRRGIDHEVANAAIGAYGLANDPVTGRGAQADSAPGGAGDWQKLVDGASDEMNQMRGSFQEQITQYSGQIANLRRALTGSTSRGPSGSSSFSDLLAARYTGAGRSRGAATTSTTAAGLSGLAF